MNSEEREASTVRKINAVGRHMIHELDLPKSVKKDPKLCFVNTIVAVSPPKINYKDGIEFDFEPELTSKPLYDLKTSKRFNKANQMIGKDPMIVVPEQQL